jgi:hypothetical protein
VVVDRDVVAPMAAELAELGELRRALARL